MASNLPRTGYRGPRYLNSDKVLLITLLLALSFLLGYWSGKALAVDAEPIEVAEAAAPVEERFTFEDLARVDTPGDDSSFYVMADTATGRQYLYFNRYYGCAVTELLPPISEEEPIPTPEPDPVEFEEIDAAPTYTEEELEMLALVIYQEAGGDACSDDTRLKVGTVVMNRVADDRFPGTIEEVLLQERQYGRLHWTGLVWPARAEQPGEAHAVARAYDIAQRVLEGERALPEDVIFQSEHIQGEIVAEQDGFYFCR